LHILEKIETTLFSPQAKLFSATALRIVICMSVKIFPCIKTKQEKHQWFIEILLVATSFHD